MTQRPPAPELSPDELLTVIEFVIHNEEVGVERTQR